MCRTFWRGPASPTSSWLICWAPRYINPALPQGEALEAFERIPVSYSVLATLVASNFADSDAQTLKALGDAEMTVDDLAAWAAEHFETLGKLIVLDAPDSACDLTLTRLQHLDGTAPDEADLSRLHRFIRLWRKLGWTMARPGSSHVALQAPTLLRLSCVSSARSFNCRRL